MVVEKEEETQVITVVEKEEEAQVITMVEEVITLVNKEDLLYLESLLKTS